ncbi:bifunctional oligoribonuclease/PAP phosphatase NrnA [Alicyclobacillus tolerans]|uniref:DHH family phosphoesterase n=1 Tax=Alicyclobacillus tolerans TaxID=90970 RepID=UPI001F221947|nr:bifunctional oligoribonuclease/PAP phosphatase NrnA [Alicyclobacillus tolerans]MCF8564797.1 bifunctional oligoribonuclease/PAP phosphatase NrnA [Alicyclobacillus tolerans]
MKTWEPAPREPESLTLVSDRLKDGDDWLIVTHERPDGDAIGSSLAVAHILASLGKKWTFLIAEPLPVRFGYLPMVDRAQLISRCDARQYRHVVAVDCADMQRFQEVAAFIAGDAEIVNIDHHRTNPRYGVAAMVDDLAAATCELVYHVAKALSVVFSPELATCLYTGILTDTGGFAQPNTTREVHQIAAELLGSGVQPYDVAEPALESRTWEQMHLLQMALANLTVSSDGRYAALYVTRGMIEGAGATDDDVEGLVGFARSIDTVEVGLLFRELADSRIKVSLRSKRRVDVSKIAQQFGGGGHTRAAGCTVNGPLGEAMDAVSEQVEIALSEA